MGNRDHTLMLWNIIVPFKHLFECCGDLPNPLNAYDMKRERAECCGIQKGKYLSDLH